MVKRVKPVDTRSLRNLAQYKNMSDKEFAHHMKEREERRILKAAVPQQVDKTISERAKEKVEEFEEDYDLSDLKYNDREALDSLINATIMLEDLESQIHRIQHSGIDLTNLTLIDKLNKMASDLRSDIIKYQDSLMITRKIRKSGSEESVLSYIDNLKIKANEFYQSRMSYVYCPECKMLLGTAWFLYPDEEKNTIRLVCNRVKPVEEAGIGEICGTEVIVTSKELMKNRNKNITDVPDY